MAIEINICDRCGNRGELYTEFSTNVVWKKWNGKDFAEAGKDEQLVMTRKLCEKCLKKKIQDLKQLMAGYLESQPE
jgi:hypothetical protein